MHNDARETIALSISTTNTALSHLNILLLPDGRVLVTDWENHHLRLLSADLQQVSTVTVAGDGEEEHRDGAAAQAQFRYPRGFAVTGACW